MKRVAVIALIVLAGFCTAGSLQAQSHEVRANVPFDFTVGGKHLPAGTYSFVSQANETIVVRNYDARIEVLSMTFDTDRKAANSSTLVFNKYGDQYFLHEIQCPSIALNVEIPRSKQEKQVRTQMAWLGPEQTLVGLY
jgi:hypothetical protein